MRTEWRPGDICEPTYERLWKSDWQWVQYSMGKDTVSLPLECWDIMKLSAKWQLTAVLCVLVCSRWKGGGMLRMCSHIYWLFGDSLLKTLCERHSVALAVCYGNVTPWPFGVWPWGKKGPVWPGVPLLCRETWNFNNLLCGVVLLYQPVQTNIMCWLIQYYSGT